MATKVRNLTKYMQNATPSISAALQELREFRATRPVAAPLPPRKDTKKGKK